jgi:hypothetical protein
MVYHKYVKLIEDSEWAFGGLPQGQNEANRRERPFPTA